MDPTILAALQQLTNTGKVPTVALLKSKVGSGFPLPLLIDAIKRFKANPAGIAPAQVAPTNVEPSLLDLQQQVGQMQQQIGQMQQQIDQLVTAVADLTKPH